MHFLYVNVFFFFFKMFAGNEKLMPSCRADLIHLNPETMQICGLHIGRPVFLMIPERGDRFVCTAWPVANFPAASGGK